MNYVLAIDVGTTFTAAAIARIDQNAPRVPESLPLGLRGTAVPSVVYYPEEGPVLVGEAAERRGLDTPERVVREFKRRVGDEVPVSVGTLSLPAEEIFATMARWVADRATEREGAPPSEIILSHPAAWGGHRTALIRDALASQGLSNATLISEPEAAALHYASQVRVDDGSTIAVYDLGGGTFDTAVLRKADAGHFELVGRPEGIDGLGGADFDAAVMRHVAEHAGEALARLDPSEPGALAALARLRRECVEAKEALSSDTEASISVLLPGVQQQVRLVRSEFEDMIDGPIRETVDALEASLQELGLTPADLSAVLLIGGSSRIPLVAQLISEQLDRPIAVDADPKSSICLGAAVAALRALPEAAGQPEAVGQPAAVVAEESVAAHPEGDGHSAAGVPVAGHAAGAGRRPSWSRAASATNGAHPDSHGRNGAKGGAHAPRPSVRLSAVAVAAALLTGFTATAAQSPDGLSNLTAMFGPQEAEAEAPKANSDSTAGTGSEAAGSGAEGSSPGGGVAAQAPGVGIEASAKKKGSGTTSARGLDVEASPTSKPSTEATLSPAGGGAGGTGTSGGTTGPQGTTTTTTPGTVPGTVPGTGTSPTTDPDPDPGSVPVATDPAVVDPTTDPAPLPDPTSDPAPVPAPTTDPVPVPAPTTDPAPVPTTDPAPAPTTQPAPAPEPTLTPPPATSTEPAATETVPVTTEPAA